MEYRLTINDDLWPKSFKHLLLNSSTDEEIHLRSNISCIDDIGKWISEFGRLTRTQWNLRQSKPSGTYVVCMRKFVCHHSSFHKVDKHRNKKGCSKNDGCNASISISVQVYSQRMRIRKNPLMEAGLWAKVRISTLHTHPLNTINILRHLQDRNGKLRCQFFGYFLKNMSAAEAKNYHESLLKENGSTATDLVDGSKNPKSRTVNYWYKEWKKIYCDSTISFASETALLQKTAKKPTYLSNNTIIQTKVTDKNINDILINDENSYHGSHCIKDEVGISLHPDESERVVEIPLYEIYPLDDEMNFAVSVKSEPFWDIANIPVEVDGDEAKSKISPKSEELLNEPFSQDEYEEDKITSDGSYHEELIESMCDDLKEKALSFGIDSELSIALEKYRKRIQSTKSRGQFLDLLDSVPNQDTNKVQD